MFALVQCLYTIIFKFEIENLMHLKIHVVFLGLLLLYTKQHDYSSKYKHNFVVKLEKKKKLGKEKLPRK